MAIYNPQLITTLDDVDDVEHPRSLSLHYDEDEDDDDWDDDDDDDDD